LLARPTEPAEENTRSWTKVGQAIDQEDLMRPTSSSTTSRVNENGENTEQPPLFKTANSHVLLRQETSSLDSTHRVSNATNTAEGKGEFSSATPQNAK